MQIRYYQTAWNDIKNSPGWFGKLCLLALLNFIPVFGQIVTYGYLYGWAREMAWGTHRPMPTSIFANDDGKFWRRGWFLCVIAFVFGLIPSIIVTVGQSLQGTSMGTLASLYSNTYTTTPIAAGGAAATAGIGSLIAIIGAILSLLVSLFVWIASMRTAIYDRLSAGFQFGKIWSMFRYDTKGIFKIFGMNLIVSLIISIIVGIVLGIALAIMIGIGIGLSSGSHEAASVAAMSLIGIMSLVILVIVYFIVVGAMFVETLVARALGYWTMQFEVPKWRGQDDPMPFELVYAAAPAAQSYAPMGADSAGTQNTYQAAQGGYQPTVPTEAAFQPQQGQPGIQQWPVQADGAVQQQVGADMSAGNAVQFGEQQVQQPSMVTQPSVEQAAVEQMDMEQPAIGQLGIEQSATELPNVNQVIVEPVPEQPSVEQPAVEQPVVDQVEVEQPVPESPSAD